jgi:DNA-3-methyladenine glycosylase
LSNSGIAPFLKHPRKLKRTFYTRPPLIVAKELLGKIFVRKEISVSKTISFLAAKIVEVEAYDGSIDEAAHTFIGKTKRTEIMFGLGGYLYVYFTYGAHYCANVVTGKKGEGTAVLIRALEPVEGVNQMALNRYARDLKNDKEKLNLTNGPGKLCKAFSITKDHYGVDLTGDNIFIIDQPVLDKKDIVISKRIGITRSVDLPWRFYIKNNPFVSRK